MFRWKMKNVHDYVGDQSIFSIYNFTEIVTLHATPYQRSDSTPR